MKDTFMSCEQGKPERFWQKSLLLAFIRAIKENDTPETWKLQTMHNIYAHLEHFFTTHWQLKVS